MLSRVELNLKKDLAWRQTPALLASIFDPSTDFQLQKQEPYYRPSQAATLNGYEAKNNLKKACDSYLFLHVDWRRFLWKFFWKL